MELINKELAIQAGLTEGGLNEDNEMEWIGTRRAWDKYRRLEDELDNYEMVKQQRIK